MVIIEVLLGYRNTFEETRDPWPWVVRPVVGLYRATPHDVPVRPCARAPTSLLPLVTLVQPFK